MSQNTLKVHDLNEDAEFDENGVEVFDEKALVEEEPSDNDLAEEELLSQGATQRVLDATQLYLGEIGYSPLLTAEEEVYFARRAILHAMHKGNGVAVLQCIEMHVGDAFHFLR